MSVAMRDARRIVVKVGSSLVTNEGRGVDANGCTVAESPIYMPDGRVQTRFVRVCRDSSGRYAVVD